MTAGRPTKYSKEMCDKVVVYLEERKDDWKLKTFEYIDSKGKKDKKVDIIFEVNLPTIEGFALFLGVNKTTLYEWGKKHKEFSNSLEEIKTIQQEKLINHGLSGKYNPTIAKLILSSNHNMVEKKDIDLKVQSMGEILDELEK